MCLEINSNSYFQNNQVLTQKKLNQNWERERERERERESTCNGELKIQHQNIWTQIRFLKVTLFHQYKVELQVRIKNQERE